MWSYPENAPHSWTVVKPSYIGQVKSKPNDSIVSTQTCRHSQTHTPCIHCTNNPHTGSIHTHTCIQHTICCMQFINFMGVIFEEFCIYICNCWHSVQVLILLVKYVFANLQVLVVLLFSHSQALSWCSEFLHSCYALNWAVPTSFLIHWHSDICRQMYCTIADLWNCNYIDSIPQDTNDRNTHELLCTCTHTVHCS